MKTETGTLIGYARVSTQDQNLAMQITALKEAGVPDSLIFTEKVSGASTKRPMRAAARRQCRPGDTFTVWRLDRVGRSILDVLQFLKDLEADGINFKSLTDSIDTKTPAGKAMMHMLAVFAEFERNTGIERIRAGVKQAKASGVKFGKPTIFTKAVQDKIWDWLHEDGLSAVQISEKLGCHPNSFRRVYTGEIIAKIRAGKHPRINTSTKR